MKTAVSASIIGEIFDNPDNAAALSLSKLATDLVLDWVIEKSVRDYDGLKVLGVNTIEGKAQLAYSIGRIDREMFRWVKVLAKTSEITETINVEDISLSCNYVDMSSCVNHGKVSQLTQARVALAMAVWVINEYSSMDICEEVGYE